MPAELDYQALTALAQGKKRKSPDLSLAFEQYPILRNLAPEDQAAWVAARMMSVSDTLWNRDPYTALSFAAAPTQDDRVHVVTSGIGGNLDWLLGGVSSLTQAKRLARFDRLAPDERALLERHGFDRDEYERFTMLNQGPDLPTFEFQTELVDRAKAGDEEAQNYLAVLAELFPQGEWRWHGIKPGLINEILGEPGGRIIRASQQAGDVAFSPVTYAGAALGQLAQTSGTDKRLPNPTDLWKQVAFRESPGTSYGYAWAELLGGRENTDPETYEARVASVSFIAQWYLSPDVIAARLARGLKLSDETISGIRGMLNEARAARAAGNKDRAAALEQIVNEDIATMSRSYLTRRVIKANIGTPEDIIASPRGLKRSRELLTAINGGRGATELTRQFKGLPSSVGDALTKLRGGTVSDVQEVLVSYARGEMPRSLKGLRRELQQVRSDLGQTVRGSPEIPQLLARKAVLEARLGAKVSPTLETLDALPKSSALYRIAHEGATNAVERRFANILSGHWRVPEVGGRVDNTERIAALENQRELLRMRPGNAARTKQLNDEIARLSSEDGKRALVTLRQISPSVSKLWDRVHDKRVFVHTSPTEVVPPDALRHNVAQFEAFMKAAGVPLSRRNSVLDSFTKAKNDADFFGAVKQMGRVVGESPLVAPGRRESVTRFSAVQRQELDTFFDSLESMREYGVLPRLKEEAGRGKMLQHDPVLPVLDAQGVTVSAPAGPEEMISFFALPDYERLIEVTSYTRRILRRAEASGRVGKGYARAIRGALAVNTATVQFWKHALILTRALLGAFQLRVIGEENVRMWAYDKAGAFTSPGEWFSYVRRQDDLPNWFDGNFLGSISRDLEQQLTTNPVKTLYRAYDRRGLPEPGFYEAWAARLEQISHNPLVRRIATEGPEEAGKWLRSKAGAHYRQAMEANIEQHRRWLANDLKRDVSLDEAWESYVTRRAEEVETLTGADARLKRAVASGEFRASLVDTTEEQARLERVYDELGERYWAEGEDVSRIGAEMRETRRMIHELTPEGAVSIKSREFIDELPRLTESGVKPPLVVSGFYRDMAPQHVPRRIRDWMYEHLISKRDVKYARSPMFKQLADQELARLKSLGWPEAIAKERAYIRGARGTADIMYDLAGRTGAQRFFRNIAPFAPAWQELMATYTWKIPTQYYPGIGHLYMAGRINLMGELFEMTGLDLKEAQKVPILGRLLTFLTGSAVPTNLTYHPESLNFVTGMGFMPGLGPTSGPLLALASKKFDGVIDAVAEQMLPFGLDPQVGPFTVNRLFEAATGDPSPLEIASRDVQETKWQFAMDSAFNQVWLERRKLVPKEKDFAPGGELSKATPSDKLAYRQAMQVFLDDLEVRAKHRARVWSLFRGIGSMFWPAALGVTDDIKQEYAKFYSDIREMFGVAEGEELTVEQEEQISEEVSRQRAGFEKRFLDRFPGAEMYLVANSIKGFTKSTLQGQAKDDDFYRKYITGERVTLSLEQRVQLNMYLLSRRLHEARQQAIIEAAGGSADKILQNYGEYSAQIAKEREQFENYQAFNPEGKALFDQILLTASGKDRPEFTIEQERLSGLLRDLSEVLPLLEEGGIKPDGWHELRGSIRKALEASNAQWGESKNPVVRDISWWFENVLDSYGEKVDKLFRKAELLPRSEQGPILDQVRKLKDAQERRTHKGKTYPTPQEFSWGSKTRGEREYLLAKWATRPLEWLSEFERGKVNAPTGKGSTQFLDAVNRAHQAVQKIREERNLHTSSKEYRALVERRDALILEAAEKFGARDAWRAMQMAPYARLVQSGHPIGKHPKFRLVTTAVDWSWSHLRSMDLTPGGGSQEDLRLRRIIFGAIDQLRQGDRGFHNLMNDLELALAPAGRERRAREDLYAALFMDDWG
jgi:hypothetical protein